MSGFIIESAISSSLKMIEDLEKYVKNLREQQKELQAVVTKGRKRINERENKVKKKPKKMTRIEEESSSEWDESSSESENSENSIELQESEESEDSDSSEEKPYNDMTLSFDKDNLPVDWVNGAMTSYMPRDTKQYKWISYMKQLLWFGQNASSSNGKNHWKSRELCGRMSVSGILVNLDGNKNPIESKCHLCGLNRILRSNICFKEIKGNELKDKESFKNNKNGRRWKYIDIYPTEIYGTFFGMYPYWPKAWNYYSRVVHEDGSIIDSESYSIKTLYPVGNCCAARILVLQEILTSISVDVDFNRIEKASLLYEYLHRLIDMSGEFSSSKVSESINEIIDDIKTEIDIFDDFLID
jgi:hypothetical protein